MMVKPCLQPAAGFYPRARHTARLLACLAFITALIPFQGPAQTAPPPAQAATQAQAPANNAPAEYVGSDTCQSCHEDVVKTFQQKNPHQLVETAKKYHFETRACESCHGPGSKHAESMSPADIKNPSKLKPAETDRICLGCHLNQPTHVGRINSGHAKNQVSCTACHSVHKNGTGGFAAAAKVAGVQAGATAASQMSQVNQLCASCHADVWATFQQPFRHRLPEGAMSCVDCHNPHGGFLPNAARTSRQTFEANEPGCFRCHGDLAGPFIFEHAPVRTEGCSTCHMPHGTNNPRMLTRSEVRFVCLECHANLPVPTPAAGTPLGTVPPAFHDLRSPRFRQCTVCHQKIHGSYVDRSFER